MKILVRIPLTKHLKLYNSGNFFDPRAIPLTEEVYWAKKSIDFAFSAGVASCSIIPVRSGNGALDVLAGFNYFSQPGIQSLEQVVDYGIGLKLGFVYADLWDIDRFSSCPACMDMRKERLLKMNLNQRIYPPVNCSCSC